MYPKYTSSAIQTTVKAGELSSVMTVCIHGFHLKPDDKFIRYRMPEFYDKTGHGLTDIMIASAKFKPVLHPVLFGQNDKYIY